MVKHKFTCDFCIYKTTVKCNYDKHCLTKKHKRNEHDAIKRDLKLKAAKRAALAAQKITCQICDKNYARKSNLYRHNRTKHNSIYCDNKEPNTQEKHQNNANNKLHKLIDDRVNIILNGNNHLQPKCTYCGIQLKTLHGKTQHEGKCSQKKIQVLEAIIERYDGYIDQLKKDASDKNKGRKRNSHRISAPLRTKIWNTYIGEYVGKTKCPCCKEINITQLNFDCGHIKSIIDNGDTDISNIIPICGVCNKSMGSQHLMIFMEKNNFGNLPFEVKQQKTTAS
jgi:hypothetical protein